ncbi:UDP-glucose/GDP-mannose dehydrogenase family protein [Metabacillus indicus]|uniref:UDP-glucose dehydrogenase family protein n=1 Tax=Metabacillus indicus TaxID=246786 RepID=UPI002A076F64|nr:UDP-glucose/GDP-mannose dehydrogenase family protein [Metabacillus indicus]MDX8288976.1 UDP-glucose/GDP-mannose dehydrogenase family protein [Metabacillus indicus]
MRVSVAGTGYVGLVTGVCLAEIGHRVTCVDIDEQKIAKLTQGISPIYEPGLEELMKKNHEAGRLDFTTDSAQAYGESDVIFIAVGTPENEDGSANLTYVNAAAGQMAKQLKKDVVVAVKSTVPVGTNEHVLNVINQHKPMSVKVEVVSNPEFLREGSAIHDTFHGDRIVVGSETQSAGDLLEELYKPLGIPVVRTDIRSAEMIKYAANAFLATKISFINEIANICEKLGADIEDVAEGIGKDARIGPQFLKAGIGYGGSCFPKDTKALVQLAGNVQHQFDLLDSVISVNNRQPLKLIESAKKHLGSLSGKKVALLGLAFKPNTDDVREAASLVLAKELVKQGADVSGYDPIAAEEARKVLGDSITYCDSVSEAIEGADAAFIVTEWDAITSYPMDLYREKMKRPLLFDGRNIYSLRDIPDWMTYISVGRKEIVRG